MATAAILTIGNEIVSGDVANTNASWLAKRLEPLGVRVRSIAALPDEIEDDRRVRPRASAPRVDYVFVTGGLGGTPDDLTREALAAAFGVGQQEVPEVAADLRARFTRDPEYAARWALLPAGSRPLANPLGGAPGFAIENVYVLPGLPRRWRRCSTRSPSELRRGAPIGSWRRTYRTRRARSSACSRRRRSAGPACSSGRTRGSTPSGPEVEVVLKSSDERALGDAASFVEQRLG